MADEPRHSGAPSPAVRHLSAAPPPDQPPPAPVGAPRRGGGSGPGARAPSGGYDRTPPHDLPAEVSVLGGMLLSRNAIAEVAELLGPEDFYRGAHRTMFEGARDLYGRGEPVDAVTLSAHLTRQGRLEDVGGTVGIADVMAAVPTAANALFYARIVAEHAVRRRLIDTGTAITKLGYDLQVGAPEAVDTAESLVFDVAQHGGGGADFVPIKDLLRESLDTLEKLSDSSSDVTGLPTGYTDLDELTAGLQPGNLVVLAARPSMGKSTLALNIAGHVAVELKRPVALFSLEMSTAELVQRILAAEGRIDLKRLKTGLQDSDWPKVAAVMGRVAEAPLFLDDNSAINLMEIRSRCRRLKQQHGLDLVIIDYLQLMSSHRRVENRVQEVSELSRGLKILAKELGVPVLALSQLNRSPENRTDRRPQLADLRESGSIEQDADIVMFIYRDEVYDEQSDARGEAELIVSKHRNGPLRTVRLSFLGHQARFANMARSGTRSQM